MRVVKLKPAVAAALAGLPQALDGKVRPYLALPLPYTTKKFYAPFHTVRTAGYAPRHWALLVVSNDGGRMFLGLRKGFRAEPGDVEDGHYWIADPQVLEVAAANLIAIEAMARDRVANPYAIRGAHALSLLEAERRVKELAGQK